MFALGVWVVTESNLLVREEVMVARHVFKNLRLAPVTNIVLPPLFSALAWGWVPSLWLILWCLTQLIFSVVLVVCYHKWSISSDREIVPDKWVSISVRLNFFGGVVWGVSSLGHLYLPLEYRYLLILIVMGCCMGALTAFAVTYRSFVVFMIQLALPQAIFSGWRDGLYAPELWMLCLFGMVALIFYGRTHSRMLRKSFQLILRNEILLREKIYETERAEAASREKSRFLAAASHDLRQPLHALGLYVHILEQKVKDRETLELVKRINQNSQSLQNLFNELLDLSKLESGTQSISIQDVELSPLVYRVAEQYSESAAERNLRLRLRVPKSACVKSDPILLERIVGNLLSNAVRYTEQGGILIIVRRRNGNWMLQVWDTGIGISDSDQLQIFNEHFQVANSARDRGLGLGLGLAITKGLCDLLEHPLAVSSRISKGSCFSVTMPSSGGALRKSKIEEIKRFKNFNVLIIDDDNFVQHAAKVLLESWGCTVLIASSVSEAIDFLHSNQVIDVVFCDIRLPDGDGIDLVSTYFSDWACSGRAWILSGELAGERFLRAESLGLTVLTKPLSAAQFNEALALAQ